MEPAPAAMLDNQAPAAAWSWAGIRASNRVARKAAGVTPRNSRAAGDAKRTRCSRSRAKTISLAPSSQIRKAAAAGSTAPRATGFAGARRRDFGIALRAVTSLGLP